MTWDQLPAMKHPAWLFFISALVVFSLPFSNGLAFGVDLNFAPGSIVRFEHLTIEDGLSQNAGLAIFQDSRGYLWIGTQDGLNRYDGYEFKIFKHDPADPATISHNSILSMGEDQDGSLWIGTWGGGLNRYDASTETFTRYPTDPENPASLSNETVTSIRGDANGNLWIATLAGLNRYNPETDSFEHFRHDPNDPNSLSSDAVSYVFEDSNRQLWIGTGANGIEGSGLNRFDPSTGTFTRYQHDDADPESLASNNIASIVEAPDGKLWIATGGFSLHGNGLDQFDPQTGKAKHHQHNPQDEHSLSGNDLMSLWLDPEGALWIGTWTAGLNRMSLSDPGNFTRYQTDPYFPDSLSGDEVWALFRDCSGILWVGTSHSGINKLPANTGQFSLYRNNPSNPDSLSINAIGAFAEDKRGDIWIATWGGGLDQFNPDDGTFTHYHHDPGNPNSLSDDLFMDVYVDSYNAVWAGTLGKGLNRLNPATGRVTHYLHDPANPASLADDNIAAILPGRRGDLWIGTFGGVSHYDPTTDTFTNYSNDPASPSSLSHNMVVSLQTDSKDILWIGTWGGGLNQLDLNDPLHTDPNTAAFTNYLHQADNPNSLSEDSVWTIHETADGFIWLGTQLGLNRLDPHTGGFKHYTEKNGLPNNVVLGILEDEDGDLWLTTNNGLAEFDRNAETFTVYDSSDGLQSNEFNSNAYFQSKDGTMYVGGINGFNLFRPEEIKPNPVAPQVVVTRFDVFNEPMKVDLTGREPIQLAHDRNFISFEFSAFDFQAPQKNQFAYKLEGFDNDWIQAGNRRYVTYTNLPGGEYIFRVKASNSDGIWNEQGVSIPVVITPPFWQTWWFIGSLALVLSVAFVGGFRLRLNSIRERDVHLETQVAERTSELRETNKLLEMEIEQRKRAETELAKHAAEELQQSEERFRATFENSAMGIALAGLDGHARMVNPSIVRMTGYSETELLQMPGLQLSYPEDRELASIPIQELLEGKRETFQAESRFMRRDGRVFWVRQTISAVRGSDGKPLYLVVMVEDIDEPKRAALALQESEARFRAMFDGAAIGIGIMGLDRRLVDANPALCTIYGRTREELIGLNAAAVTYPDDDPDSIKLFEELIAGQRDSFEADRRYIRKNGEVFWAHVTMSSVRGSDGKPMYLVGMVIDIDEQKKMQEQIRESEARFRAMFDSAAIGIGMMDLNRRVIRGNLQARGLLGYSEEELNYLDVLENTHPDDRVIDSRLYAELVSGKRDSYQVEKRYRHKDGHWVWARSTLSAVKDSTGHPLYILALVEDISEHKRTLEELSQSAERLRESEARFRAMFDNAAVGMALMTMDRKVLQINKATERITGYPLPELMSISPSLLAHPDDRYLDRELFERLVKGEIDQYNTEKRYVRKNDEIFWGRVTYTSVRNANREPEYLIGMIEDITEQRRTAERLAEQEAEYLLNLQQRVEERTHELAETNQRLHKEIEQRLKIEEELARKAAEEAVTADRTRLARDLHDAVTQTLFSASLTAEVLPDLWDIDVNEAKKSTEELRQLTRGALAEMRTLLLELRPAALTQTRLSDLIKQLCDAFIGRSRLPITLTIEGERDLPPEVQIACYRIAQESLNNVFKYARATQVHVALFLSPNGMQFEICDNGIGFDMSASKPTSLGMRIMRERAEAIGADFHISSTPGAGTCVEVAWVASPEKKLRVL